MQAEKKDPYTGEMFIPRRYNQKFASRENQIAFNNEKARKKREKKHRVDRILDKNREILLRILGKSISKTVSKDYLMGAGFDLNHFSGLYRNNGKSLFAVYEFYLSRTGENFEITKL